MSDPLTVWWNGRIAGSVRLDHRGDMTFAYSQTWLENVDGSALSFSLPKREQPFGRRECQPFFEGLLPEGEQRSALAKALGLSAGNEFRLLERLGGEIAGAVTLWPEGQIPPLSGGGIPHILDDENLLRLLRRLPSRPMLAGEGDLRLALAGAQSKLPVLLVDGNIALPAPGQPTSHILKPAIPRFEQTVDNEYYCLSLARAIGLDVAPVTMRHVGDRSFLLIERYDRTRGARGQLVRLHQEDFAQALGVRSERKYASDGGPTFKDSFALLRQAATHPARAISKLTDAAIFNLVIGNADAHAKNFSLLHIDGTIRLAPLYDLLSTVAYPELSTKLAMRIGRKATLEEIEPRHWDRFAADVCVDGFHLQRRVRLLCEAILAQLNAPDSRLSQMLPDGARFIRFTDLIGNRANRLLIKTG